MQPAETFRVLAFLAVVVTVFVLAAGIVLRSYLTTGVRAIPPTRRAVERAILACAVGGLLCVAYGHGIEPYWLEITRVVIPTQKLRGAASRVRIVQISDVHSDPRPRLEETLPELIAAERPDLIIFTGDAINSVRGLPVFRRCLTRLASIAPTFVVKGNWDAWYWNEQDLFGGTGAREVDGSALRVEVRGVPIWITGFAVDHENRLPHAFDGVPGSELSVLLYHYPDLLVEAAQHHADLYLAGHTHGGQIALPWYGALVTYAKTGKRYEAGLYRMNDTWLYVNRGIGMEGGPSPRVRFCARPEVSVIDLVAAELGVRLQR